MAPPQAISDASESAMGVDKRRTEKTERLCARPPASAGQRNGMWQTIARNSRPFPEIVQTNVAAIRHSLFTATKIVNLKRQLHANSVIDTNRWRQNRIKQGVILYAIGVGELLTSDRPRKNETFL